ncbi:MAG TPA: hypothetical protein VF326_09010, partial [Anaerolineaceae bacterium]
MIKKKGGMVNTTNPPRWDLSNVYPGLDSDQFKMDNLGLSKQTDEIETFFSTQIRPATPVNDLIQLNHLVCGAVDRLNQAFCLSLTLNAYIQSFVTTDSYNTQALRLLSTYEQTRVRLDKQWINFRRWIGSLAPVLPA